MAVEKRGSLELELGGIDLVDLPIIIGEFEKFIADLRSKGYKSKLDFIDLHANFNHSEYDDEKDDEEDDEWKGELDLVKLKAQKHMLKALAAAGVPIPKRIWDAPIAIVEKLLEVMAKETIKETPDTGEQSSKKKHTKKEKKDA